MEQKTLQLDGEVSLIASPGEPGKLPRLTIVAYSGGKDAADRRLGRRGH